MKYDIPAVILSGGSEVVAVSIAEALFKQDIPLIVIGLGTQPSLIRDVPNVKAYRQMNWPPPSESIATNELIQILKEVRQNATIPWPVFATEDGGLRLLLTGKQALSPFLAISHSPYLTYNGLDKAELFEYIKNKAGQSDLAPTMVLHQTKDSHHAFDLLGEDVVFKPALKPVSMKMQGMSSKVITAFPKEKPTEVIARLAKAWPISPRWIAQKRLIPSTVGEALWWGLRTQEEQVIGLTAYERWKQPKVGGSGCWVQIKSIPELDKTARHILKTIDFKGIVELPFLKNNEGRWQLIEMNPRPWLQVGLPEAAGLNLIFNAYLAMLNKPLSFDNSFTLTSKQWVNPERMIIAALSGDYGSRLKALHQTINIIRLAEYKSIYSTPFPMIRRRWIIRMLNKIWQKILPY